MRTLSRPMFNMGGPIKQGIMHGIREPHKDGKIVGGHQSPYLAGAHPWKDKSGREHHVLPAVWATAAGFARFAPMLYRALSAGKNIKNVSKAGKILKNVGGSGGWTTSGGASGGFGTTPLPTNKSLALIPETVKKAPGFFKNWWSGDPTVRSAKWLKDAIMSPTAKGWGKSLARGVVSPSSLAIMGATGLYHGLKDKPEELAKKGGGDYTLPGGGLDIPKDASTAASRAAFAKSQREARVQKYLEMMGYDRAKKTAIADALIDASKIVSDRGTLDPKNITQELINPIIQATSKRLDKPDQIREAVGLMMTKAGLEKEMYDAKPGTQLKAAQDYQSEFGGSISNAYKQLGLTKKGNFSESLGTISKQYGKGPDNQAVIIENIKFQKADEPGFDVEQIKILGDKDRQKKLEKEEDFISITDSVLRSPAAQTDEGQVIPGIYVIGTAVIEVKENGTVKRLN